MRVRSRNSSGTSVVEPEQPTEALATLERSGTSGVRVLFREEDHVSFPLVGSLNVVLVAYEEFLVDGARDVGEEAFPGHANDESLYPTVMEGANCSLVLAPVA